MLRCENHVKAGAVYGIRAEGSVAGLEARMPRASRLVRQAVCLACMSLPVLAVGQTAPAPTTGAQGSDALDQRMQRLEQRQQQLEQELKEKDAETQALKKQQPATATGPSAQPAGAAAPPPSPTPGAGAGAAATPAAAGAIAGAATQGDRRRPGT